MVDTARQVVAKAHGKGVKRDSTPVPSDGPAAISPFRLPKCLEANR